MNSKFFDNYEIFDPKINAPLETLSRREAECHFKLYVESWQSRLVELQKVLNHFNINLDYSLRSIEEIDKVFASLIASDDLTGNSITPESFSICNDLSLYFAGFLLKNCNKLKWELNTDLKDWSYHRPVLRGFNVKNKKYYIDFDLMLCQYAHYLIKNGIKEGQILRMVESALNNCN